MSTAAAPITVNSASDMMAAVPADFDSQAATVPDSIEVTTEDTPETPVSEPESVETEPISEPAEGETESEPADATAATEDQPKTDATEELPDGVTRGKDQKGKQGYFLEEGRYRTFHGNHKLVQQGSEIFGEPVTAESLKLRNDAFVAQERLFNNLNSGDPSYQTDVIQYILGEMRDAQANGEVGADPTVPFADSVYQVLQSQAPDAYAHLRLRAARDLVGEMFDHAARAGDQHLFSSAQRFAAALANVGPKPADMTDQQYATYVRERARNMGVPFYTLGEMQGLTRPEDPLAQAQQRINELQSQLNGRSQTGSAAQYDAWLRANVKVVNEAIDTDALKPSLAVVAAGWKNFPDDFRRLVSDPLHREVVAAVKSDPRLDLQVKELQMRAHRATSEQVRAQLGEQIKQLFVNRAKQIAEQKAPPILKFAADWLKGRSDKAHERRSDAQSRTTPKGQGSPVKSSVVPADIGFKNGIYDPAIALKQMQALIR